MPLLDSGWIWGFGLLFGKVLPVDKIGKSYLQSYPQEKLFSHPIHILERG
jgi:hypothetical protein